MFGGDDVGCVTDTIGTGTGTGVDVVQTPVRPGPLDRLFLQ